MNVTVGDLAKRRPGAPNLRHGSHASVWGNPTYDSLIKEHKLAQLHQPKRGFVSRKMCFWPSTTHQLFWAGPGNNEKRGLGSPGGEKRRVWAEKLKGETDETISDEYFQCKREARKYRRRGCSGRQRWKERWRVLGFDKVLLCGGRRARDDSGVCKRQREKREGDRHMSP
jgi:hypothetical protein